MSDQAIRQLQRQSLADPQSSRGRELRLLERSGVDVYGDFARSVEDWAIRARYHVEGVMIDEEHGFVMIAESHEERLDRERKEWNRSLKSIIIELGMLDLAISNSSEDGFTYILPQPTIGEWRVDE